MNAENLPNRRYATILLIEPSDPTQSVTLQDADVFLFENHMKMANITGQAYPRRAAPSESESPSSTDQCFACLRCSSFFTYPAFRADKRCETFERNLPGAPRTPSKIELSGTRYCRSVGPPTKKASPAKDRKRQLWLSEDEANPFVDEKPQRFGCSTLMSNLVHGCPKPPREIKNA